MAAACRTRPFPPEVRDAMLSGKKVLCGAPPTYAHTIPALKLGLDLRADGNQLNVLANGRVMDHLFDHYEVARTRLPLKPPRDLVGEVVAIIERYGPDITICDWRFDLFAAVQIARPACRVSILRCEALLGHKRRNLFLYDKHRFDDPDSWEVTRVNELIRSFGSSAVISDPRELFRAEIIVVPSVPELDPLPDGADESYPGTTFVYTGPLVLPLGKPVPPALHEWIEARRREGMPVLAVSVGTVYGASFYKVLCDWLKETDLAVVIAVPFAREKTYVEQQGGPRVRAVGHVDLGELAAAADIVLHHCGHGTMHSVLLAGKPSITLPGGEYDLEDNALRLEDHACGRHLGHDFFRNGFSAATMSAAVRGVLSDGAIAAGVAAMSRRVHEYRVRGAAEFTDLLSKRLAA